MEHDRKIGIIGGMGPAATWLFYRYVTEMTEASCDQDHVNMVILSDAAMPDRTAAILSGKEEPVMKKMREDVKTLVGCGCEAVAVTCNTAHFFMEKVAKETQVPLIHMLEETAKEAVCQAGGGKIAILATRGTIQTGLYQKRLESHGGHPFVPSEEIEALVMSQIYDRIKKGLPAEKEVWEKIAAYLRQENCACAIMGCTELSVVKEELHFSSYYIDPMRILAARVITYSGREVKPEYR
ncbi:MAG: amino acid racemase [Lachnospiraceae bacterium]|nr:amino acid racemase [Lachnospiraceae bacterium]